MITDNNMKAYFDNFFSLTVANSPILRQQVYRIRYQVYCEELNYEPQENFPEQMEQDEFDDRSIHVLLKHKPSGTYIGCVRIVLADHKHLEAPFPFEKVCQHQLDFSQQPRHKFFEISRLAVVSKFRRRPGEQNTAHGLLFFESEPPQGGEQKRGASLIAMSLYLACTSIGISLGYDYALTLMEARLQRHLRWCGVPAHLIGNFVEFHGKRGPFILKRTEVLGSMKAETRELFEGIHSEMSKSVSCIAHMQDLEKRAIISPPDFSHLLTKAYEIA